MTIIIATLTQMNVKKLSSLGILAAVFGVAGCASTLNTAESGNFSCSGLPAGVTCKTPAAVYKSSHGSMAVTDFDTPVGSPLLGAKPVNPDVVPAPVAGMPVGASVESAKAMAAYSLPMLPAVDRKTARPRPVREPAQVMRIWIAPWVSSGDVLHLAQLHYVEIVQRSWTVGKPEVLNGAGYVIPHLSFDKIGAPEASGAPRPNVRPEQRASDSRPGAANAQTPGAISQ